MDQFNANFMRNAEGHWWVAVGLGLIPIPFGWLFGWMLLSTARWIRRGGFGTNL